MYKYKLTKLWFVMELISFLLILILFKNIPTQILYIMTLLLIFVFTLQTIYYSNLFVKIETCKIVLVLVFLGKKIHLKQILWENVTEILTYKKGSYYIIGKENNKLVSISIPNNLIKIENLDKIIELVKTSVSPNVIFTFK